MKTKQILTAGAIALSMILTGCSSSSTETKDTKTTEVAKKKEVKTIGQKSKDSKSLKITNNTGKKITVFETKSSSEESFSDNLLEDGDSVKNKEERILYYEVKENDKLDVKVGLQDQDKTFVFKDVDTTDTKKVDVSLKEDKVNLDVTKKDGTTATLTPSEDSAKTEDEKKEEQKVKQEEKKEETAKADSSNKSNASESKKDNTASTTNTSSNKNNTSSSKPAEHTHNWVAQYKTVNVPEKGHNEQVLVQAAYDEQVPIKEMQEFTFCSTCGANITGHAVEHLENSLNCQGYYTDWREVTTGYNTVHHEAVYETRYVVDSPATTKQELTGYKCSGCGKTKAN
ncbi:hypothetical protein [Holdemanella sp.]|uniref:hypothetical protein n=1 Tax=Holdemanella sp. TaxID=1971762 RepID=UPI00307CC102